MSTSKIIWTKIDEAPALATYAFLPVVRAFTRGTGVEVETRDISLAGRIIAGFSDHLDAQQQQADDNHHHVAQQRDYHAAPDVGVFQLGDLRADVDCQHMQNHQNNSRQITIFI